MKQIDWAFDRNGGSYFVEDPVMMLRFCLRELILRDPEMLCSYMGKNPVNSIDGLPCYGVGDEDVGYGINRRRPPELGQFYEDWPEWAEYRIEVDEDQGFIPNFNYYDKTIFEGYVKQALKAYRAAYPESHAQVQKLIQDLEL
jgi:hypothetical protein